MSLRVWNLVWENSRHGGTELLMMLAIADHADARGVAWPSVPTLAKRCRMSDRNANHLLAKLASSGELEVQRNAGPRGTNLYRITLTASKGVKPISPPMERKPLKPTSPPTPEACFTPEAAVTLMPIAAGGEAGSSKPLKPTSPEPSLNRQEPSERVHTRGTRASSARTRLPAEFGVSAKVMAWAAARGFDRLDDHLEAFRLKAEAKGYTYADWDAAFKTAIRDDWAGLRKAGARSPLHADDVFEVAR